LRGRQHSLFVLYSLRPTLVRYDLRSWVLRTESGAMGARMAAPTGPSQVEVVWFSK